MPINFPSSLDTLTNPQGTDDVSVVDHAEQHSNANDILEALEAKVGINDSAVTTSLDYKVRRLPRTATFVVAASNANDTTHADYICDGTADEVQINQAISDLPAAGGKVVLSDGLFTIADPILIDKSNVVLEGQGDGTQIKLANSSDVDCIQIGDGVDPYSHISVKHLLVNGNEANQTVNTSNGININASITHAIIQGCRIQDTSNHNIVISGDAQQNLIADNYLDTTQAGSFASNISSTSSGQYNVIRNNVCTGSDWIDIDSFGNGLDTIEGNTCFAPTDGPTIHCYNSSRVIGNYVVGNANTAAVIEDDGGTGTLIADNTLIMQSSCKYGIICGQRDNITNNVIISTSTVNSAVAIQHTSTQTKIVGNSIFWNASSGNATFVIECDQYDVVANNTITVDGSRVFTLIAALVDNQTITANTLFNDGSGATTTGISVAGAIYNTVTANILYGFPIAMTCDGTLGTSIANNSFQACVVGITSNNELFQRNSVIGNTFIMTGADICMNIGSTGATKDSNWNTISGNTIDAAGKEAIKITNGSFNAIAGNTITNAGKLTDDTYAAILLQIGNTDEYSTYNTINGNTITSTTANKHKYGIRENSSSDGPNIISSNIALNADTAQISTQHVSTQVALNIVA